MGKRNFQKFAEKAVEKAMQQFEESFSESFQQHLQDTGFASAAGFAIHDCIKALLIDSIAYALSEYDHES